MRVQSYNIFPKQQKEKHTFFTLHTNVMTWAKTSSDKSRQIHHCQSEG